MRLSVEPDFDTIASIRSVLPLLAANPDESERRRWIADENIAVLEQAGFFRMSVPKRFGGTAGTLAHQVAALAEIATACPSTAWACALWAGSTWAASLFPSAAQEEIFSDPSTRVSGIFAPTGTLSPVDGGYLLSGSWKWNTGCRGADWDGLAAVVAGSGTDGPPDIRYVMVPMGELTIHDDWFAMGAAATGSSMSSASDVFVPEHRVVEIGSLLAGNHAADAEVPADRVYALFPMLMVISIGPYLGMARGALNAFLKRVPGRGITYSSWTDQAKHPHVQMQTAKAALKIDAASALIDKLVSTLQEAAEKEAELSVAECAWVKGTIGFTVQLCREAVELLWSMAGASAIMTDVPLQRYFRDIESLSLHAVMAPDPNYETHGRVLLGQAPGTPFL
jgi:3-hydroxy-9,10-secoandrosta-1,3,5(10)-triene-9,17-dione monooxygenase